MKANRCACGYEVGRIVVWGWLRDVVEVRGGVVVVG
jgi:hypothetical protein